MRTRRSPKGSTAQVAATSGKEATASAEPASRQAAETQALPEARRTAVSKIACETDASKGHRGGQNDGCTFTFNIHAAGDININNYCSPPNDAPPSDEPGGEEDCFPCNGQGSCLPPVAGAKHKLSRTQKFAIRAARGKVPSVLAGSTLHAVRRRLAGHTPGNALEQAIFARLDKLPASLLRCISDGFDQIPPAQRSTLISPVAEIDVAQPLDPAGLMTAVVDEIKARAALELFGDPNALEERPGQDRLYVPVGEDFFTQVRICRVDQLRTANYIPSLQPQEYTPDEIQHDCAPVIVDGTPEVVCEVRTTNCPGNPVAGVCGRVLDISKDETIELEGVNFFDINAKVRFVDKETGTITRDAEAFIYGDVDTPRTEMINGETRLINDCRVHDKALFTVPDDLPPGIYSIQVVVPNSVNNPGFGPEILSNTEYINVLPPPNARYQIVVERIIARKETAPASWGSDEVGLRVIAAAMDLAGEALEPKVTKFQDLDGVEFDSGTARSVERIVFSSEQPILALVLGVMGHEIDSDSAYNRQINDWSDIFVDLVKEQWKFLAGLIASAGGIKSLIKAIGWKAVIVAAIIAVIVIAIDLIYSLWAPADLIIEDSIALSIIDLDRLTSVAAPVPPDLTFKSPGGITVNVNKTIPPEKIPFQYRETREYVSDEEESRYELTYRYNRLA